MMFQNLIRACAVACALSFISGCASSSAVGMDGSVMQLNQYTGLTIGYGYFRSVPHSMDYAEQTETVSTSWFNSNARDYRRITVWASSHTNLPPQELIQCFLPNVNTDVLYSTQTNGESVLKSVSAPSVPSLKDI